MSLFRKIYSNSLALALAKLSHIITIRQKWLSPLPISAVIRFILVAKPDSTVLQIGANDGVSNDPLARHLRRHQGKSFLVEALPYYYDKLIARYANNPRVHPINALVGDVSETQTFYYIDPHVASQMNGEGPMNNWAHGQGSLSRETIVSMIMANSFRGKEYKSRIPSYVNSIKATQLKMTTLRDLCDSCSICQIDFLILDVQGSELNILKQIPNLRAKPLAVMFEIDQSADYSLRKKTFALMNSLGYNLLAADASDAIFCHDTLFSNRRVIS